ADEQRTVRALHVEQDGEDKRGDEAGEADKGRDHLADRAPREDRHHQQQAGGAEKREDGRESEPVDVRLDDHFQVTNSSWSPNRWMPTEGPTVLSAPRIR